NIYLGGAFTSSGLEQEHRYLAKVIGETNGALDPNWRPNPDNTIWALAPAGNDLYVGGRFASIGGLSRRYLAKVSGSGIGEVDTDWQHQAFYDPDIFSVSDNGVLALLANGEDVHVGGQFTQ